MSDTNTAGSFAKSVVGAARAHGLPVSEASYTRLRLRMETAYRAGVAASPEAEAARFVARWLAVSYEPWAKRDGVSPELHLGVALEAQRIIQRTGEATADGFLDRGFYLREVRRPLMELVDEARFNAIPLPRDDEDFEPFGMPA